MWCIPSSARHTHTHAHTTLGEYPKESSGMRKPGQPWLNPEEIYVTKAQRKHKMRSRPPVAPGKTLDSLPLCFSVTKTNTHMS